MGRTKEIPLPVPADYIALLKEAIEKVPGKQKAVAKLAGVDQGTVSRTLTSHRATYTTLDKLSRKLELPAPVVMIRKRDHAKWCELGALLLEHDEKQFKILLGLAENHARLIGFSDEKWFGDPLEIPAADKVDRLKSMIANPLRTKPKRSDRRG